MNHIIDGYASMGRLVPDVLAQNDFPMLGSMSGWRTFLAAPFRLHGELIGILTARRAEVSPFTSAQIKLLETFANQAVIAIENARLFQELTESLEQQTATSQILGVIAGSPTDIQPVLTTVAENAARACDATDAIIRLVERNVLRRVAHHGTIPASVASEIPIDRSSMNGRSVASGETIHVHDLLENQGEFPGAMERGTADGVRTALVTPLLRGGVSIGTIFIRRTEVRAFSEKQIALLKTFADQAVIAIENVRLFQELKEALEQQTATSEILGVIASSPTDIQPVLDVVAENAARLCDASNAGIWRTDGVNCWPVVFRGPIPIPRVGPGPMVRESNVARAMIDRQIIHSPDMLSVETRAEFPNSSATAERLGVRTALIVPLLRESDAIGAIHLRRNEVRPFTDKQIALVKTFADQAVIAIENVRLFKEIQERNSELREALEHQTATAEVLGIISRSPTDVQPVLDAIVESAARVCGIDDVVLRLHEGDAMVLRAHFGPIPTPRRDQY